MRIKYTPCMVSVTDERDLVPGARCECAGVVGTAIPPEGWGVDCWVSELVEAPQGVDEAEWVEALAEAAVAAAAGHSGSVHVERD